ncbi:MAG TPA: hypothetical protein VE687_07320, partial [Stellaceae bacterium]|nr:hypothetical protein [Stellaceae bacterium]
SSMRAIMSPALTCWLSVTGTETRARDFWRERGLPGRDESIIGRLKAPGIVEVKITDTQHSGEKQRTDRRDNRVTPEQPVSVPFSGRRRRSFFGLTRWDRPVGNRVFQLPDIPHRRRFVR